jgi:hypothetical protein
MAVEPEALEGGIGGLAPGTGLGAVGGREAEEEGVGLVGWLKRSRAELSLDSPTLAAS